MSDPRLTPARPDLAAQHLRATHPAERYAVGEAAHVRVGVAPVHRRPGADQPLDTQALFGEAVTIYERRDGWAWVQLARDAYVGYVPLTCLGDGAPSAATHRVNVARSFVYARADLKSPVLDALPLGAEVSVTGIEAGFAALAGGGFVFVRHLREASVPAPDPVAVAEALEGVPYLWGGRSSFGLDCSGLVQLGWDLAGVIAPRDSDMQAAGFGEPLDPGADLGGLRRGDLVFWKGHVGIMRDAATLLHANAHHMLVAIEPLAEAIARIEAAGSGAPTGFRRPPPAQK